MKGLTKRRLSNLKTIVTTTTTRSRKVLNNNNNNTTHGVVVDISGEERKGRRRCLFVMMMMFVIPLIIFITISITDITAMSGYGDIILLPSSSTSLISSSLVRYGSGPSAWNVYQIDSKMIVVIDFEKSTEETTYIRTTTTINETDIKVTLGGTYNVKMIVHECNDPKLWLRLEGEALMGIVLYEDVTTTTAKGKINHHQWTGSLSFPLEGKYQLVAYWYGCDDNERKGRKRILLQDNILAIKVTNETRNTPQSQPPSSSLLFPTSIWISSKNYNVEFLQGDNNNNNNNNMQKQLPDYIWHNPSIPFDEVTLLKTSDTIISQEGSVTVENKYYKFDKLSNYELVCFFGSQSAEDLRKSFLQIRPLIFQHQRPFKFHMYRSDNLQNPSKNWTEGTQKRLRKCKHIFISFDEIDTLMSQREYTNQITSLINHLLQVIPDDTFPIWILSLIISESNNNNNNNYLQQQCHSPYLQRSSYHPCNAALKELFDTNNNNKSKLLLFPDRVRFLDSTDISFPQFGKNNNNNEEEEDNRKRRDDVLGAIALRIFVVVGKQVQIWRDNGQEGTVKGLVRNGQTEPNIELTPYKGWAS